MTSQANLRREVLQLYREILRTTRIFAGQKDASHNDYSVVIARSARAEFERARGVISQEEIVKRIVVGRDALHQIHEKVSISR